MVKINTLTSEEPVIQPLRQQRGNDSFSGNKTTVPLVEASSDRNTGLCVERHEEDIWGLSAEQWKNMNNSEKIAYIIETATKAEFSEAEWATMTDKQKNKAQNKFVKKFFKTNINGWEKMSSVDKLDEISKFINIKNMADVYKLDLSDIYKMQNKDPEKFKALEKEYYETHKKVDILADEEVKAYEHMQQARIQSKSSFETFCKDNSIDLNNIDDFAKRDVEQQYYEQKINCGEELNEYEQLRQKNNNEIKNIRNYATEHGIEDTDLGHIKAEYQYLKSLKQDELTEVQKIKLQELEEIKQINGGSLDEIKSGTKDITSLFLADEVNELVKDAHGRIDFRHPQNIKRVSEKIIILLGECKSKEEIIAKFQKFDISTQRILLNVLSKKGYENKFADDILRNLNFAVAATSIDKTSSDSAQSYVVGDGYKTHCKKLKARGIDTSCMQSVTTNLAGNLDKQYASKLQVTTAELEDEVLLGAANEGVGQREDALEVFAITNNIFANSTKISDNMKQFYAKNSVEVLKTPEMRDAQTKSLKSYNLESFNKGVSAVNTTAISKSSVSSSQTNNSPSQINIVPNSVQAGVTSISTPIVTISTHPNEKMTIQQAYTSNAVETLEQIRKELNEFASLPPQEQKEKIASMGGIRKIPVKLCDACLSLVQHFVDAGKGLEVVRKCSINTGNEAIKLMMETKNGREELLANVPNRLSKFTQHELEQAGVLKNEKTVPLSQELLA